MEEKVVALLVGAIIFIVGVPLTIVALSSFAEKYFHFPSLSFPFQSLISFFFATLGLLLSASAGWYQLKEGKGSPLPFVPTQKLVTIGPYELCRNPMALGAIVYYIAISVWMGSVIALGLTVVVSCLFLIYIKMVEEKELEKRFGEEYRMYKRRTPFLIPKFLIWRRS